MSFCTFIQISLKLKTTASNLWSTCISLCMYVYISVTLTIYICIYLCACACAAHIYELRGDELNTQAHTPLVLHSSSLCIFFCSFNFLSVAPRLSRFSFQSHRNDKKMVDLQTVCCMCGDVGFPDKLFRCSKCRNRSQHSYTTLSL